MPAETNLVLEHLRAIRGDVGTLREDMREVKVRLNDLHSAVAGQRLTETTKRRVDLTDA